MAEKNRYHCQHDCNVDGAERCPVVFETELDLPPAKRYCKAHQADVGKEN